METIYDIRGLHSSHNNRNDLRGIFTLLLLGDKFKAFQTSVYRLDMYVSWWAIVSAVVLSYLTVLISVWFSSVRAGQVSAIAVIRQNQDIKVEKRQIKVSKLFCKIFGMEAVLARKYYGRDRKKYRTTVMSLMVSIVLVVSTGSLNLSVNRAFQGIFVNIHEYDAAAYIEQNTMTNEIMKEISELESVEKASIMITDGFTGYPREEIKADYNQIVDSNRMTFVYMDDISYEKMLRENDIWEAMQKKKTDEYPGILLNTVFYVMDDIDEQGNPTRIEREGSHTS